MMFKFIRRIWSALSQPSNYGLSHTGDWRVQYPDGNVTRWLHYGEAANLRNMHGGKLQWRHDGIYILPVKR